jgi:hypothetical protein
MTTEWVDDVETTTVIARIDEQDRPTEALAAEAAPGAPGTPAAPAPVGAVALAGPPGPSTQALTCPECGTPARVTVNRREAEDFCRTCDYPLFWTPAIVVRDRSDLNADPALRRLPGTVGRVAVASFPCPHCAEPNALGAEICVRCGRPMRIVEAAPPPPQPIALPPAAVVEPEPEPRTPWWVWVVLGVSVAALITLLVLKATGVVG